MIDPELKEYLSGISANLAEIKNKKNPGVWRSFFNGMFGALGYIAGLAIVATLLVWFLQYTGMLKPIQEQAKSFTDLINSAKQLISPSQNSSSTNKTNTRGQTTTVTLPDGQQVQVQLP